MQHNTSNYDLKQQNYNIYYYTMVNANKIKYAWNNQNMEVKFHHIWYDLASQSCFNIHFLECFDLVYYTTNNDKMFSVI
jgi:hypothetical protein